MIKYAVKVINEIIENFKLDLKGYNILTEEANGTYSYNHILASLAGANVFVLSRDSKYGDTKDIQDSTDNLLKYFKDNIKINRIRREEVKYIDKIDIIYNSGHVRPITKEIINNDNLIVLLGYESWELRDSDIDINHIYNMKIPLLATNEQFGLLKLYGYIGFMALKFLFEIGYDLYKNKILIIGSDPLAFEIQKTLSRLNVKNLKINTNELNQIDSNMIKETDVIIICEHRYDIKIFDKTNLDLNWIESINKNITIGIIAGNVTNSDFEDTNLEFYPKTLRGFGYVNYDLYELNFRPALELYATSLKAGEIYFKLKKDGKNNKEINNYLKNIGIGEIIGIK